jgi:hypothetical protein
MLVCVYVCGCVCLVTPGLPIPCAAFKWHLVLVLVCARACACACACACADEAATPSASSPQVSLLPAHNLPLTCLVTPGLSIPCAAFIWYLVFVYVRVRMRVRICVLVYACVHARQKHSIFLSYADDQKARSQLL